MSEFGVLDCIIRDTETMNSLDDSDDYGEEENNTWNRGGGFDVLSASMHGSGLLGSTGLEDNNDVSRNSEFYKDI